MKNSNLIASVLLLSAATLSCEKEAFIDGAGTTETTAPETRAGQLSGDEQVASGAADREVLFNPQPEPPARTFEFDAIIRRGGNWSGEFHNAAFKGRLTVKTLSSLKRGRTIHLVQSWTFYPEPVHPPEPVIPPTPMRPVTVMFKGTHNTANGMLVLNGKQAHVKGKFISSESSAVSVGGELMFNPQPEPPAAGNQE